MMVNTIVFLLWWCLQSHAFLTDTNQSPEEATMDAGLTSSTDLISSEEYTSILAGATGNEITSPTTTGLSIDQCPSVLNLRVREERYDNQTMLILNWDRTDHLKVTNSCVTLVGSDIRSECSKDRKCGTSSVLTEVRLPTPCPYQLFNLTVNFLCDEEGPSSEIQYMAKPGAPTAPRLLTADAINATSVTVLWEKPERTNGPLDGFTVSCLESGSDDPNSTVDILSSAESWSTFDLQPWTNYTIRIYAFNFFDDETKLKSPVEEVEVQTLFTASDPPLDVRIASVSSDGFVVEWNPPMRANGVIRGYRVSWSSWRYSELVVSGNVSATETFMEVKARILPFTEYRVTVAAINDAGIGQPSEPVNVTTMSSRPGKPGSLSAVSITNSTIFVKWKPPTIKNGIISQYTFEVYSLSFEIIENVTGITYQLNKLQVYTEYQIRVKAWTIAGDGEWSKMTTRTDVGVPSIPKKFLVKEATAFSLTLTWNPPVNKNGPIDGYCFTIGDVRNCSVIATTRTLTISELIPWTSYEFKLSAFNTNNKGNELSSEEVSLSTRTEEHRPGMVNSITVLYASTLKFSIRWNSPIESNGIITDYVIRVFNSTLKQFQSLTTTNTEVLVEGLEAFTQYYFSVSARNNAGESDRSEYIAVTTDVGVPGVPEELRVQDSGPTYIYLVWDEPLYKAGPINGYDLSWYRDEKTKKTSTNIQVLQSAYNFTGLTPWSPYLFNVKAYNQNKKMQPLTGKEATIRVRTPVAVPLSPSIVSVMPQSSKSVWIEWKNQGIYPGPDSYVVEVWKKLDICQTSTDEEILTRNHTHAAISWNVSSTIVRDLDPFTVYIFRVVISTSAGSAKSNKSLSVVTEPDVPSKPRNFHANCSLTSTSVFLSWDSPEERNGIIVEYQINYFSQNSSTKTYHHLLPHLWTCETTHHQITMGGFYPETMYWFAIKAKTNGTQRFGSETSPSGVCILPAGVPPIPDNSTIPEIKVTSEHDVTLKWSRKMFSAEMGRIIYYSVIVASPSIIGQPQNGSMKEMEPLPVWADFYNKDTDIYQATPQNWNPFQGLSYDPMNCQLYLETGEETLQCIVGWEKNCSLDVHSYCNGPLKPGMVYGMKLRGFTRAGFADSYPLFVTTESPDNSIVLGLTVGLVMASVVMFGAAGLYILMKRKSRGKTNNRFLFFFRRSNRENESTIVMSSLSSAKQMDIPKKRPYDFPSFLDHIKEMLSDSGLKFSLEYETLKQNSPRHSCSIAEMEENRSKNRWTNILPFDHSRVKLLPIDDEPGSDYINASYIPGYSSHREYIASQGPLPSTADDFWRMIWEQKVCMIVMLTQCVERGKAKCELYWPKQENGEAQYGDLQIRQLSEVTISAYAIRIFRVSLGSRECIVKHMHYIRWPDFGCPESPEELVNFVKAVRNEIPSCNMGPVLVHCSAGVGRTGTFMAVDRLLQHVQFHSDLDIYNTVLEMREHRTNMVQTEDQYIYIHKCLRNILLKRINYEFDNCNGYGVFCHFFQVITSLFITFLYFNCSKSY